MNCQWLYESVLQSACITVNFQSQMCYNRTRLSLQTTAAFEAQLGCPSLATLTLFSGFLPSCFNLIETTNRALTYLHFVVLLCIRLYIPQRESADAGDRLLGFLSLGPPPPNLSVSSLQRPRHRILSCPPTPDTASSRVQFPEL
jgi:hypothetical protein